MRLAIVTAVAFFSLAGVSIADQARASIKKQTRIPAQELSAALQTFAQERDLQIVFVTEEVNALRTAGAVGEFTTDEALKRLLSGTGLSYRFLDEKTITVQPAAAPAGSPGPPAVPDYSTGTFESLGQRLRLAQVSSPATTDSPEAGVDSTSTTVPKQAIPEILIAGSRSLNVDIERSRDDIQPYVVFGRRQIEQSASGSLEEFLKTRLPMNTTQVSNSQAVGAATRRGNQSSINLRGLGPNQTLILVNGRRMPNVSLVSAGGDFAQPDINGIPMSAIERVEVLPSTASGIYGGGATGGVVNIILRQNYSGLEFKGTYENTFDADMAHRRLDANAGFDLEGGKTKVVIAASFSDSNKLLIRERDFNARARALALAHTTPDPAAFQSIGEYTSNIVSADFDPVTFERANLVLDDGTPLNFNFASVPIGYAGPQSDGGARFLQTAGQFNLDLPNDLRGGLRSSAYSPTVRSVSANIRREFGKRVDAYLDLLSLGNHSSANSSGGSPNFVVLGADAPNNPFQQSIAVSFPSPGLSVTERNESDTARVNAGVIVRLPRGWMAQSDYGWSNSKRRFAGSRQNSAALSAALSDGSLDVMRDLNTFPLDYSLYLLPSPNLEQGPNETVLTDASLRLAGPAMMLPAGPLSLSALFQIRDQEARESFSSFLQPNGAPRTTWYPGDRAQEVKSVYLETNTPLVSARSSMPFVRQLDLQASIRHDEYETRSVVQNSVLVPSMEGPFPEVDSSSNSVRSTDFTLGLKYAPVESLVLRASFGTGFLPPSLPQIASLDIPFYLLVVRDPQRDDTVTSLVVPALTGGNADLDPEESRSFSAGAIFTPGSIPGLRLSIDYTDIRKTDEIASLSEQEILDNEAFFAGRVTRADPTPEDIALGYSGGEITGIDLRAANIARSRIEAIDVQTDYRLETAAQGTWQFHAVVTRQQSLARQILAGAPEANSVGFADGPLRWRGNAGVSWERGAWTLGWNTQYYDSYFIYPSVEVYPGQRDEITRLQGSERIPHQVYHDLFARFRIGDEHAFAAGALTNTDFMLGIRNVFDTSPPIIAALSVDALPYSGYGDPRLRMYTLSMRKRF